MNSHLVGCSTGSSAGFEPLRILSTKTAARRYMKFRSGPYVRRPPLSAQLAKPEIVGKRFFIVNSTTCLRSAEETAGPNPVDKVIGSLFSCRSKCVREIL